MLVLTLHSKLLHSNDHLAYGSFYQWGRFSDGHELITWTSATAGTPVNGTTSTKANVPGHTVIL